MIESGIWPVHTTTTCLCNSVWSVLLVWVAWSGLYSLRPRAQRLQRSMIRDGDIVPLSNTVSCHSFYKVERNNFLVPDPAVHRTTMTLCIVVGSYPKRFTKCLIFFPSHVLSITKRLFILALDCYSIVLYTPYNLTEIQIVTKGSLIDSILNSSSRTFKSINWL